MLPYNMRNKKEQRENFQYTQGHYSVCCEGAEMYPTALTGDEIGSAVIRNDSGRGTYKKGWEFSFHPQ